MRGCENAPGEAALMLRLQMRETSNPKHGYVTELHASVHCHLVGKLTDDAPDFPPLSSSLLLSSTVTVTVTLTDLPTSSAKDGEEGDHRNTEPDYSRRTVIEYVTNALRAALGNQIKK